MTNSEHEDELTEAEIAIYRRLESMAAPEPSADFEQAMWARIAPHLDRRYGSRRHRRVWTRAAAAALVAATAAGTWAIRTARPPAVPAVTAVLEPATREQVFLMALDDHLAQTQLLLVEVLNAPEDDDRSVAFERQIAEDLVQASRLYRNTAEQTGKVRLAETLEDLERVFLEIARSPDTLDGTGLRQLRTRIDDGGLLFKVRAVTNDIRNRRIFSTISEGAL